jgi:hypothetical protein
MRKFLQLLVVLVLMMGASVLVSAQDDLSEEEQQLLERAAEASNPLEEAESFAIDATESQELINILDFAGQVQEVTTILDRSASYEITLGDTNSGTADITVNVLEDFGFGPSEYTVNAEARYVDDTLYVNASFEEGAEGQFELPEGWVVVDPANVFEFAGFENLGLQEFVDFFADEEEDETSSTEQLQQLLTAAAGAFLESGEVDGEEVDIVTINFGFAGLIEVFSAQDETFDPEADPILSLIGESAGDADDLVVVEIALDDEDNIVEVAQTIALVLEEIDSGELDPELAGGTFSLTLIQSNSELRTQIGEEFSTVEAPEVEMDDMGDDTEDDS